MSAAPLSCCCCGRVTADLYRVDPVTGAAPTAAAWCPECYEDARRRADRLPLRQYRMAAEVARGLRLGRDPVGKGSQ